MTLIIIPLCLHEKCHFEHILSQSFDISNKVEIDFITSPTLIVILLLGNFYNIVNMASEKQIEFFLTNSKWSNREIDLIGLDFNSASSWLHFNFFPCENIYKDWNWNSFRWSITFHRNSARLLCKWIDEMDNRDIKVGSQIWLVRMNQ